MQSTARRRCAGFHPKQTMALRSPATRLQPVASSLLLVNLLLQPAGADFNRAACLRGKLSLGHRHTCTVLDSGGVKCWGEGSDGRLGYNDTIPRSSPPSGELLYLKRVVWSAQ